MTANRQDESSSDLRALQSPATVVQPRSVPNAGPAIVDLVIDDLRERATHGEAKYGTKLQAENGRVALVDAYQEVLDLAQYVRQEIEERRLTLEALRRPVTASRRVLYFAAPLRPTLAEMGEMSKCGVFDVTTEPGSRAAADLERAIRQCAERANLNLAKEGLSALRRAFSETTFIAPWIASVMSGEDDADQAQREAGLVDDCAVVERCDGIVLWGSRLSDGMRREMEHGVRSRDPFEVYNLVGARWRQALTDTRGMGFADWYSREISCQRAGL